MFIANLRMRGFTLIEILTIIAILAIILSFAVPAMGEFIHNARLRNSSMELRAILMRARSEAIHRNLEVQVVPTAGNWRNGWTLQTTDGAQIERFTGLADVTVSPTPAPTVVYRVDGRVRAGAQRIVVSLEDSKVRPRCISISPSGLASTRLDSNFDPADGCT